MCYVQKVTFSQDMYVLVIETTQGLTRTIIIIIINITITTTTTTTTTTTILLRLKAIIITPITMKVIIRITPLKDKSMNNV